MPRLRRANCRGAPERHSLDAGVHQLQGEAEGVTPTELAAVLQACYAERLALMLRHQAVARHVGNLDFNNTYQYVIAREDTHLAWIRAAIEERGGVVPESASEP